MVGLTFMASAQAQVLDAARVGVRELGKQWNGQVNAATTALYTRLQRQADRSGVRTAADLRYGDHALQTMDIVWPDAEGQGRPIVVYLHGGGFVRGDKTSAASDHLIYANVATFVAKHDMVGVNANYRLAPDAQWPAGAEDVRAIVRWLKAHAADYGGDTGKIYLLGNSAGAAHIATYLFHEPSQLAAGPGVAGALLSSGAFAAEEGDSAYYGGNRAENAARAPLGLVDSYAGDSVPVFLWSAELDPPFIEQAVASMYAKLCDKYGDCPRFAQFQGHNHVSHVMSLNSADDAVGQAVIEFLEVTRS